MPAAVVDGNDVWAVRDGRPGGGRPRARAAAARRCSSARPTGTTATRSPTRRRTARRSELEHWLAARPAAARARAPARRRRRGGRLAAVEADEQGADRARGRDARGGAVPRPRRGARDGVPRMSRTLEFRARDPRRDRRGDASATSRSSSSARTSRAPGGVFAVTPGLYERFGADRVLRHADLRARAGRRGLRRRGHRAAAGRSRSCSATSWRCPWTRSSTRPRSTGTSRNEQGSVPLVVRSAVGAGGRFGAIHSQIHGDVVPGRARPEDRVPVDAGARPRDCSRRRSATTTRSSSSSTSACTRSRARRPTTTS